MIVSTNQPYFAPYPGFFYKAYLSDCFVILDDVQFPRKTTWITRNRFKNDQGTLWLTIPVRKKGLGYQKIRQVKTCDTGNWRQKFLRSFYQAYAHAPYLRDHVGLMEKALSLPSARLLDLNMTIITAVLEFLGIETRVVQMSELGVTGKGTSLIVDICRELGADRFLVQSSAMPYYPPADFAAAGIERISFTKPDTIYPQMWGNFIANLSVIDMIFTCGEKTRDIVLRSR